MPRTKKPAGQAVDRRNGRQAQIGSSRLEKFYLPARKPAWLPETRKAWLALWDDPVSSALSPADRPVLLRWADALERAQRFLALADLDPVAEGSQGQPVENPLYGTADKQLRVVQACEAQLGVGALHRAKLGLSINDYKKSLADVNKNARYSPGAGGDDDEPDPRVVPGEVIG